METAPINTQPVRDCYLCGTAGEILYSGMRDRSYAAPGEWNNRRCPKPDCGLIWLDPQPTPEDIGKAYQSYYTHNQPAPGSSLLRDAVYGVWRSYLRVRLGYRTGVGPAWRAIFSPLALLHPGGLDELDSAAMYLRGANYTGPRARCWLRQWRAAGADAIARLGGRRSRG